MLDNIRRPTNIIGIVISVLVAIFLLYVPNLLITKLVLAPLFGILAFLLYKYLTGSTCIVQIKIPKIPIQLSVAILYLIAILFAAFVPSVGLDELYLPWSTLFIGNIIRVATSILLFSFLRGYVIAQLIGKWGSGKMEVWLSSFLLSVFVTSIIAFANFRLFGTVSGNSVLFFLLDLSLVSAYLIAWKKRGRTVKESLTFEIIPTVTLFIVIAIVSSNILIGLLSSSPVQVSDGWNYYGMGYRMFVGDWPTGFQYPWFFFTYLAAFYQQSGVPSINAYQSLEIINIFSILAFFFMVRSFFAEKITKVPVIATLIFFLTGGLGWLYGLSVRSTLPPLPDYSKVGFVLDATIKKTMDYGTFMPRYLSASDTLSFVCLFILIFALSIKKKDRASNLLLVVLSTVGLTAGYLSHFPEMIFFLFLLSVILLLIPSNKLKETAIYSHLSYILIFSLFSIILFDVLAPTRYYTNNLLFLTGPFLLPLFINLIKQREILSQKSRSLRNWLTTIIDDDRVRVIAFVVMATLFFVYLYSFVIWAGVVSKFQIQLVMQQTFGYSAATVNRVPWYFYPMLLGIPGVFALFGFTYLLWKKKVSSMTIFLAIALTALLLAVLMRLSPIFEETRIVSRYLWIAISVLSGFALIKIISTIGQKFTNRLTIKQVLSCIIILLFLLASIPSNIYYTELVASFNPIMDAQLSNNELNALNWLRLNRENNSRVLTVSATSAQALSAFASDTLWIGDFGKGTNPTSLFLETSDPVTLLRLLYQSNIKYIYIADRDQSFIKHDSLFESFIEKLNIAYENNAITVYKVPPINAYNDSNPDALLINPSIKQDYDSDYLYASSILSFSGISYNLLTSRDSLYSLNQTKAVLTEDVSCNSYSLNGTNTVWVTTGSNAETIGNIVKVASEESQTDVHDYLGVPNKTLDTFQYAAIEWKTDSNSSLWVAFRNNEQSFNFLNLGTSVYWKTTVVNLTDKFNSKSLDGILFRTFGNDSSYQLKTIKFSNCSVIDNNLDEYLEWVKSGGHLFVLGDGSSDGAFAKLLSLQVPGGTSIANGISSSISNQTLAFPSIRVPFVSSTDNLTYVTSTYSDGRQNVAPFTLEKPLSRGSITYVLSKPYFEAIENSNADNASALFSSLGQLGTILLPNIPRKVNSLLTDVWDSSSQIVGNALMSGEVLLEGYNIQHQVLPQFNAESFSISYIKSQQTTIENIEFLYAEIVGSANSSINAVTVNMTSPYSGPYVGFDIIGKFNYTIILNIGAKLNYDYSANGNLISKTVNGPCTVDFQSITQNSTFDLILRHPKVTVNGVLSAENLRYTTISPYFVPMVLTGNISLIGNLGSQNFLLFDEFAFIGMSKFTGVDATILWNEWQIPWETIVISPSSIILIASVLFTIMLYVQIRRKYLNRKAAGEGD
jgi:hypothetical protein